MPAHYYTTEGIIFQKMPFGESDFLIRIFTRDFGKLDFLAKGARNASSKLNAHFDTANHISLAFVQNGERIPTLTNAEVFDRFDNWFLDVHRITFLGRMIKTLDSLLEKGLAHQALFDEALNIVRHAPPGTDQLREHAQSCISRILKHEGYEGMNRIDVLPSEVRDSIITIWPDLRI